MNEEITDTQEINYKDLTREQIIDELKKRSDDVFDPETVPKLSHNWTHRGIRHICEGAGHPRHEAFSTH